MCVPFQVDVHGAVLDVLEEFTVVAWSIAAEVLEDAGQWCIGHANVEEVVTEWDLDGCESVLLVVWARLLTMLSLAPDSPRKDKGSSETPSYTTPCGNMD